MSIYLQLHQVSPQRRFIRQAVEVLRSGGVIVYPTDSCYALGCHIGDKAALERIREIRQTDRNHHFTLVCRDLADVGKYAVVDNSQYRPAARAHSGSLHLPAEGLARNTAPLEARAPRTIGCGYPITR